MTRTRVCFRFVRLGLIAAILIAGSYAAYCGAIRYAGNFHVVEEGRLYRSGQLDRARLEKVVQDYRIKSIVNLRGSAGNQAWYRDEVDLSKALGVAHYDYRLKADKVATPQQIVEILNLIRLAAKPILIHCRAGSDRSGFVAALYLFEFDGKNSVEAADQLSLFYGHFPYLTSETGAMDRSFWRYVESDRIGAVR